MQIPILVEPVAGNGFRSRGGELFDLSAEGVTPEDVRARLQEQLQARLRAGAAIVTLEVAEQRPANPWIEFAAMFKDDPYFEEWQKAIEENRRKIDEDTDVL
jgi:hypothetical protein